ncbi:MAG: hypothetical protein HOM11_11845 [Methylococcales bacterium]|nr:hypothetical protein [Methylococcales bacterium]MBT7445516.1 hypothetical protein [Methylococcales bacterium]
MRQYEQMLSSASDTSIEVILGDLSNDLDLYVKKGSVPTAQSYDCRPYTGGRTTETCTFTNTGLTDYYISVNAYQGGSYSIQANLTADTTEPTPEPTPSPTIPAGTIELSANQAVSDSVSQGNWKHFAIVTSSDINVVMDQLSNDVDLYVRKEATPTAGAYDCRPYKGNTTTETCSISNTTETVVYISVYGYSSGNFRIIAQ